MVEVATSKNITMSFIIHDDHEPEETENGLIKKMRTRRRETPKSIHEYFVFSLYSTI